LGFVRARVIFFSFISSSRRRTRNAFGVSYFTGHRRYNNITYRTRACKVYKVLLTYTRYYYYYCYYYTRAYTIGQCTGRPARVWVCVVGVCRPFVARRTRTCVPGCSADRKRKKRNNIKNHYTRKKYTRARYLVRVIARAFINFPFAAVAAASSASARGFEADTRRVIRTTTTRSRLRVWLIPFRRGELFVSDYPDRFRVAGWTREINRKLREVCTKSRRAPHASFSRLFVAIYGHGSGFGVLFRNRRLASPQARVRLRLDRRSC